MPAPVIDLPSSLLSNPQHRYWEHQFSATGSPTSWAIASGGFPSGMTFDSTRGLLFGAATAPFFGNARLTATNGDGTSAEALVTIAIWPGAAQADGAIELEWDLGTGAIKRTDGVTFPEVETEDGVRVAPILMGKEDDDLLYRLVLKKNGAIVDLPVTALRAVLKQAEPLEPVVVSSEAWLKEGSGSTASYLLHAHLASPALANAFSEFEGEDGTWFLALAEFELEYTNPKHAFFACLTTALTGTNNDLFFCAVNAGPGGNAITVRYLVSGNSTALSVSVSGNAITVNVATDSGGAPTSTAAQVAAAIAASAPAAALVVVSNAASNDGTGIVTAMAATALAGGRLGVGPQMNRLSSQTFRHRCERDLAANA